MLLVLALKAVDGARQPHQRTLPSQAAPLQGILGFSELLAKQDVDEETSKRYLEIIHGEAQRLTGLVDGVRSRTRLSALSNSLTLG